MKDLYKNLTAPQVVGLLVFILSFGGIGTYAVLSSHADTANCTYHATTSTFASTFSSATGGSTICLAPGNYGDWTGGSKTSMVTIMPDPTTGGTAPTAPTPNSGGINANGTGTDGNVIFKGLDFTNASFITMNGITFSDDVAMPWGTTTANLHDVTITNSIFHAHLEINDANMNNANVIINYNMFPGDKADCINGPEGRIQVATGGDHKYSSDGVIVENNNIGGVPSVQCDGIQSGSSGMQVLNNWFHDYHYHDSAHTDGYQNYGSINETIKGNFFYDVPDSFVAYDGMSAATIENNVSVNDCSNSCDGASPNQVQLLANTGSTLVNHNTVVGGKDSYGNVGGEGNITLGSKGAKCSGITVTNNVATSVSNGSGGGNCTYTASYNLLQNGGGNGTGNITGAPAYVGGDCGNLSADPPGACGDVWANFMLKPTSLGVNKASDGTNMGAYGPGPSTPGGPFGSGNSGGGGTTTPPPPAPTASLTASPTSVASGATSKLTWTSANATACSASWTSSTATNGSVTLTPAATTTYTLTCNGAGGSVNASAVVTVTASQPVPTVTLAASPTSITAGATSKLTWSTTNATACTASWAAAGSVATSGSVSVSPTATTTYTITCNGAGGSVNASAVVTVKVPDSKAPVTAITAPANNASVQGTVNITASATDDVGVTKVEIYVDNNLLASLTASPYTTPWNALAAGNGTHTISSKAYDAAGNVGTSTTTTVTVNNPDTTAPTTPANLQATAASPTQVNLAWSASTDAGGVDHYIVERNNVAIATVKSPTLAYNDTTVSGSTSYTYNVVAVDKSGNASTLSNTATVKTPAPQDTTPPTTPTNLQASAISPTQVNLNWAASTDSGSGVAGYQVFRNGVKLAQVSAQTTTYGDGTVSANTAYSYYIVAVDGSNNASQPSNTISVTTPQATTGTVVLVGSTKGGNSKDSNDNGMAEAFRMSSVNAGNLSSLTFFNDSASSPSTVVMGIYSDNNGKPGSLLTQGSTNNPAKNAWVKVPISSLAVHQGTAYWIAIMGLGSGHGKLVFHDNDNGTVDYTSRSNTLKSLPATWQNGTKYNDAPLSVYGTN